MSERKLLFPPCGFVFDTHTETQNKFIKTVQTEGIDVAIKWLKTFKNSELSHPAVLTFKWEGKSGDLFEISENSDFSKAYSVNADEPYLEISNLKIGTEYFWRVNGGKENYFFTADNKFRFIKIGGILNVRDIGGINIKQGLLYRGSDFDLFYKITDDGKRTFCDELKIKTEIELRADVDGGRPSAAGESVILKHFPYRAYCEVFDETQKVEIFKIFKFLSHEENYPVYIHCLGGADRTGMIAFFLRAIAGECDDDILLDYELTSLSTYAYGLAEGATADGFRMRNSVYNKEFLDMLSEYAKGKPISEQVVAFLHSCNVTDSCIEKVRSIIKNVK